MKAITFFSGITLLFLFIFSYVCDWVFKIRSDKFYQPFHFAGGFFTFIFINSLLANKLLCLILVILIGVIWEIYEWLLWKLVLKKKRHHPREDDTKNDLLMDFWGGLTALILGSLIQIILKLLAS